MKLLPPASDIEYINSPYWCFRELWWQISYTYLLRWELVCDPFKMDGRWTAAMRRPKE